MKCLAVQPRLIPLLLVFACVVGTCGLASAQPASNATPSPSRADSGDLIRESDLKFRLEDVNGTLRAVPGLTLERLLELEELEGRIKMQQAALPKAVFTGSIELEGQLDRETRSARLDVTFRIRLTPRSGVEEATWTAIPLRLDGSFLDVGRIEHQEAGEIYVTRDEAAYVCWVRAAPDTTHTIRVPIKVPVQQTGAQSSLNLALPNMATTLRLTVGEEMIDAFSPSGRSNVSSKTNDGETLITVESGGGELDLAWQQGDKLVPHALEASCATTVHVHGNHIWSEADLKVRSRSEPIDSFIVRLPDEMELTSRSDAEFQISPLPSDDGGPQQVLVKRLGGVTPDLIEVHLEAALPPIATEKPQRTVQLGGFSVQDSVREWGSLDVILDGNWSPTWTVGQFVQRVAVSEDPAREPPVAARFLYDRQPYSVRLELRPKQTRASLDAHYLVDVAEDNIQLEAQFEYSTNGAKVDALLFRMPGWTIEAVTPEESLAKPFTVDEKGLLTLPVAAGATEFDFRVHARHTIEKEAEQVSFDLPRPADSALLPNASLTVRSSDNVELTPELSAMKWLTQETRSPSSEVPERGAPPPLFREELSAESNEASHFVARRRIRPRETTVVVTSDVTLDGDMMNVRQVFSTTVAFAPLADLPIAIPTSVLASGTLRITDGQEEELAYREVASTQPVPQPSGAEPGEGVPFPRTTYEVNLPEPVTGEFQIEMAFELSRQEMLRADRLQIPLIQPAGDEATANVTNTLTLRSDENTAVRLADESWTMPPDSGSANGKHELRIRSTGDRRGAVVRTSIVEGHTNGSASIPRVWIQSWLTPTDRRDRVCFQLLSDQPLVHIQLPATAQNERLRVLVDGKSPIEFADHGDLSLTVTLAEEQVGQVVGLELWYYIQAAGDSRFRVALPTIDGADRAERVYWQLVLPQSEHLAWSPATLTSELVWQRGPWYWGRRGRLEQPALEELVGASTQEVVSPNTNRYLFSSTGSVDSVTLVKVSRRALVLATSGLALVMVLPFIYLPTLRQPAVFLIVGVLLFGVAVTYPEHAAMLGQAGAIGLGLGIVAYALHRLVGRSPAIPATRRGSVYITPDSQASGAPMHVHEGSSRVTTATAPAHLQVAQVEGDS